MQPSVMIVERDEIQRNILVQAFTERGYLTWCCPEPDTVVSLLTAMDAKMVIVDLDGLHSNLQARVGEWKAVCPHIRIIVETSSPDPEVRQSLADRVDAYFLKPISMLPMFDILEEPPTTLPRAPIFDRPDAA